MTAYNNLFVYFYIDMLEFFKSLARGLRNSPAFRSMELKLCSAFLQVVIFAVLGNDSADQGHAFVTPSIVHSCPFRRRFWFFHASYLVRCCLGSMDRQWVLSTPALVLCLQSIQATALLKLAHWFLSRSQWVWRLRQKEKESAFVVLTGRPPSVSVCLSLCVSARLCLYLLECARVNAARNRGFAHAWPFGLLWVSWKYIDEFFPQYTASLG